MSYKSFYRKGDWNAICDVCGRQYKASELKARWDGFMVCHGDWEPRQPQDFVRGVADTIKVPWSRPEPADYFLFSSILDPYTKAFSTSNATLDIKVIVYTSSKQELDASTLNDKPIG